MSVLAIKKYAPDSAQSPRALLRNARSAAFANMIRALYDAEHFSVTDLAEVLSCDRAHAWRLLNGGRATAEELGAALGAFRRAA